MAKKRFQSLFLALALMAGVSSAWADDSGTCGIGLKWTYVSSTHTLTISGTGEMSFSSQPWTAYTTEIEKVVVESGGSGSSGAPAIHTGIPTDDQW